MNNDGSFPRQFAGKVAVVTGGTQGLGETTARLMAARGAAGLVLVGRNTARGEAVAASLSAAGTPALFVAADLAAPDSPARIIAAAEERFSRIDCLVNAAGLTDRGTIEDTGIDLFDRIFAVNVRAPFFLTQGAVRSMQAHGIAGTVVNILSMSSHGGQPFISAYSASKGALLTLTRNNAYALLRHRIRVNGLNIGWTDTPGETDIQRRHHGRAPGWLAEAEATQPFGRLIKPDEVARAVCYLASDESGLMTGSIVDFDQTILGAHD